jgi:ankyrin repeat protein
MLAAGGQIPRNVGLAPAAAAELTVSGVQLLLDRGADAAAFNRFGQTALHFAVERGADVSVVELLVTRGADPDVRDRQGRTALDLASMPARGAANENRQRVVSLLRGVTKSAPAPVLQPAEATTP